MSDDFKTCVMIGLGFMLPTAAVIARTGITALGVNIDQRTVDTINAGQCPIEEKGLPDLAADMIAAGRLSAETIPQRRLRPCCADARSAPSSAPAASNRRHVNRASAVRRGPSRTGILPLATPLDTLLVRCPRGRDSADAPTPTPPPTAPRQLSIPFDSGRLRASPPRV